LIVFPVEMNMDFLGLQ